jgi:hypothetical protein
MEAGRGMKERHDSDGEPFFAERPVAGVDGVVFPVVVVVVVVVMSLIWVVDGWNDLDVCEG